MLHDTLIFRQLVIAITFTPVRHKRHMQFLTSAPNFIFEHLSPNPLCAIRHLCVTFS